MALATPLPDGGTKYQQVLERDEWLERKREGIGGSQAAAVLGVNRFASPARVWAQITGRMDRDEENNAMRMGLALEGITADLFTAETGLQVERYGGERHMLWWRDDRPWHLYSPDGLVQDPDRGTCLYEGKTGSAAFCDEWTDEDVPLAYYFQGQWGCALDPTLAGVWYAVLLGGQIYGEAGSFHLRHVFVPRDDAVCVRMVQQIGAWWERHVVGDEPPMVGADDKDVLKAVYPASSGKMVAMDVVTLDGTTYDLGELLRRRQALKDSLTPTLDEIEQAENILRLACGEADGFTCADGSRYTNKSTKESLSVDLKALEAARPGLYRKLVDAYPKRNSYRRPYYYPATEQE